MTDAGWIAVGVLWLIAIIAIIAFVAGAADLRDADSDEHEEGI